MNSYMTIMVRVVANRAQAQLAALRGGVDGLSAGISRNNSLSPLGQKHITSVMKFGNQLQWTGRMLQYNFTLPLVAAAGAATKFAMDQEAAMTHVAKVYGDTTAASKQFQKQMGLSSEAADKLAKSYKTDELNALDKAFTAISNHFGVQKKEVLEVAGAWAAAGASGRQLAESVRNTMTAMIIGDMDAASATKALISIQAQYGLNTEQLMATLANLNSVENQTAAGMSDLITGFEKAAGVARSAGVDTNHLAAYIAALVPATGSAANAGNALKTIFSRLVAPTKETTQVLGAMGINVKDLNWQNATAVERMDIMAHKFDSMSSSAKNAASSVIASRWQINRFDIAMREIVDENGNYQKALKASSDQAASFANLQSELNTVLESDPRKLQRMWVMLQNASVEIIQPLIPFIIYLAQEVGDMAQSFANLNPHVQKFVLLAAVLLAAVGPVVRYIGALTTLYGVFAVGVARGSGALLGFARILASITFLPLLKGLSVLTAWIGGTTGLVAAQGSVLKTFYFGLLGFFSKWTEAVAKIFTVSWFRMLAIDIAGMTGRARVFASGLAVQLLLFRSFWLKLQVLWTLATLQTTSRWAAMWLIMQATAARGLAAITATSAGAALVNFFRVWVSAITTIWVGLWTRLVAISAAGWALVRAQWVVMTVGGIGLFSKFRAALITIWTTLAAANAVIWRGIALTMVMFSRAGILGVINVFKSIIPFLLRFGKILTGPIGIGITVAVGLLYAFRDQIGRIFQNIVKMIAGSGGSITDIFRAIGQGIMNSFKSLPMGIQKIMISIVTVIRDAALAVYEWFSYINPFAHHSPSLVENVTNGMTEVNRQFSKLGNIKNYTTAAYAEIKRFGELTAKLGVNAEAMQRAEDRATLKKAGAGAALASYDRLVAILNKLLPVLKQLDAAVDAQQKKVDTWQKKVDAANKALDEQQKKLDALQKVLDGYQQHLDDANAALQNWASTPIQGMRDMDEQIFQNTMAQKRLRYEMMKLEDVTGPLDDIKQKLADLQGAEEMLSGRRADLRAAGAGSEILSVYDQQINALEQQKRQYGETASKLNEMQKALDALARKGEELDLEKSLKFDELTHQIELASNTMEEMPFDVIMAGIAGAREEIAKYTPLVDAATKAVEAQQAVVDSYTQTRDALQSRLEAEQEKLDALKDKYNEVNDAVQAINNSLNDVVQSADKLNQKAAGKKGGAGYISPGLQNFLDAGNAGFPDPGGLGMAPRIDWSSQQKDIDDFTKRLSEETARQFAELNPFVPLKKKALEFWDWLKGKAVELGPQIGKALSGIFDGVGGGANFGKIGDTIGQVGEFITNAIKDIAKVLKWGWDLLGPDIQKIASGFWNGLKVIWEKVGPELAKFGDLIKPFGKAIQNIWTVAKPILAVIAGVVLALAKVVTSVIAEVIGPLMYRIGGILSGIIKVIRGFIEIVVGILSGDWKLAWQGVVDVVSGTFGTIWNVIAGAGQVIWNIVQGIVKGIVGFFTWLWDVLVGHSIIPDTVNAIIWWFNFMIAPLQAVWNAVWAGISFLWNNLVIPLWNNVVVPAWQAFAAIFQWAWDNVIKPAWDAIGIGVQAAWLVIQGIWAAIKWTWENVLAPIFKWAWENVIKPAWNSIKAGIQDAWTVIQGIWNSLKAAWDKIAPIFQAAWDKVIGPAWNAIKSGISGAWDKIKTILDAFTRAAGAVKNAFDGAGGKIKDVWDGIKGTIGRAVDWITDKVDKVMGLIDKAKSAAGSITGGLDFNFDLSSLANLHFAKGGVIPYASGGIAGVLPKNSGPFVTNSPVALVGEGNPRWPEFVIPTDPRYRNRAENLWAQAGIKLGVSGIKVAAFAAGGTTSPSAYSDTQGVTLGAATGVRAVDSSTHIYIYGNLEFPNIRSDSDAEEFIRNLEGLAG